MCRYNNLENEQLLGDVTAVQALLIVALSCYTVGTSIKLPLGSVLHRNRKLKNV